MGMSENKPLGIVIPTRWEAKDVLRHFEFKRVASSLFRASIHDRTVLLCIAGVGRDAAVRASVRLVASGAHELVSMGFCGALVPELHVGDLITHRVITVNQPARTPDERRALTERANALAVDMETQAVIEAGTRAGVPIRILRVVSDGFEENLTPLLGQDSGFSIWRIALRLINPATWPLAARLARNSRIAQHRLVDVLEHALS